MQLRRADSATRRSGDPQRTNLYRAIQPIRCRDTIAIKGDIKAECRLICRSRPFHRPGTEVVDAKAFR